MSDDARPFANPDSSEVYSGAGAHSNLPAGAHSLVFAQGVLSGQVALVTGGGTGLGRATAIELARCGARVMVMGRREDVLEQAVIKIGEAVGRETADNQADWIVGDVRDRDDAERIMGTVIERMGRLDALINNAGGQYFTPAEAIVAKGWKAVWRLNVEGIGNMAQAAVEAGIGAPGAGTIVNVTLSPHHGMPGMAHSGAARATVEALTREMAERWAGRGIAVTAVAAGHFDTEAMGKYPDTVRAGMARSVPLQRLGRPQEHAWLVALLCTPMGRMMNGSTITLDGARDNWFGPWPPPGLTGETGEVPTEARRG